MKIMTRDFNTKEKVLLLLLAIILIILAYYWFIETPVSEGLEKAEGQKQALKVELEAVNTRVAKLQKMQNEIDGITKDGLLRQMPSYNNSKNVNKLLNDVLGDMGYSITFSNVTQSGDQIRRNISLHFIAPDYKTVRTVLSKLSNGEYRCLLGDIHCSSKEGAIAEDEVTVSATLTFFETMVGGTPDAGLPAEE